MNWVSYLATLLEKLKSPQDVSLLDGFIGEIERCRTTLFDSVPNVQVGMLPIETLHWN